VRNEDNFSLQLETLDGEFRLFLKPELNSFARQREPLMPSDYGSTFSAELNDLVAFLLLPATHGKAAATSPKKSKPDDEDE
jgi:cytochrome c oxidase cbb3-type subunit 3